MTVSLVSVRTRMSGWWRVRMCERSACEADWLEMPLTFHVRMLKVDLLSCAGVGEPI